MLYRIVGFFTGLGTLGFFALVLVGMIAPTRARAAELTLLFAFGVIALGSLVMMWHVTFVQRSDDIKKQWRTFLIYFGPVAAAAYLWGVAPNAVVDMIPSSGDRLQVDGAARQPMRVAGAIFLSVTAFAMTWAANRMLTPFDQFSGPAEAALNCVLRIGFVISAAILGSVLRLAFWPWIAVLILPSLIAIYVAATGATEVRAALLAAALFLAWILSRLTKRGLSAEV